MKNYVAGFLFNAGCTNVALVEKQKPEWQRGKLNGIGGKIDLLPGVVEAKGNDPEYPWLTRSNADADFETPVVAMVREFREETAMESSESDWTLFCVLHCGEATVNFFFSVAGVCDIAKRLKTTTAEKIIVEPIRHNRRRIANLEWLIPMAISAYMGENSAKVHIVHES